MGAWQSRKQPPPCWSNLSPELLDLVLRRLPSLADRLRFIAVCRHWLHVATRYSAPHLPRALPWLNFHDGSFRSLPVGEPHSLRFRDHTACVGSFGCWLLFEQPPPPSPGQHRQRQQRRRRHFLVYPLRPTRTMMRLPRYCREPVDLIVINNNNNNNNNTVCASDGGASYVYQGTPPSGRRSTRFIIEKVIVCSADLVVAIMMYYRQPVSNVVVCCRPGRSSSSSSPSSSWSTGIYSGALYHDMAFFKGKVYTVTCYGELFVHDIVTDETTTTSGDTAGNGKPRVARVERLIQSTPPTTLLGVWTCFLVITCTGDKLLMVRWIVPFDGGYTSEDPTRRMTLQVFEADFERSRWVEVESLDGQVLFLSSNSSRAISVSTAGHGDDYLQGNRIYFVDRNNWFWRLWRPSSPRTCGVYDMCSRTFQSISFGGETHMINHQVEASWFFPHG